MALDAVLFICLGNLCRSPLAEAVFQHIVDEKSLSIRVDSAGTTDYHRGSAPDERSQEVAALHKVSMSSTARQLSRSDFDDFDIIVGMDKSNVANIEKVRPKGSKTKVVLFGAYVDGKEIRDPYYDNGLEGFEKAYQQCVQYSEALLLAEM